MVGCEGLGVEEGCTYLESTHVGCCILVVHFHDHFIIHGVGRVDDIAAICKGNILRDDVTCKELEFCAGSVFYFLLDQRSDCCSVRRCDGCTVHCAEIPRRESVLGEFVDEVLVECGGKVSLFDFGDIITVPNEQQIINVIGTEEPIIIEVSRNIPKIGEQSCDLLPDLSRPYSCFVFACQTSGRGSQINRDLLSSYRCAVRADKHVVGGGIDDFFRLSKPPHHDGIELREGSLRCKCSLGEIIIDRQRNLTEDIKDDCLYLRCIRSMQGEKICRLGIIAPSIGVQAISCIVELLVAVKATVYPCHVNKRGFCSRDVISKHTLADNHVEDGSKDFILSKLPREICHVLFFLSTVFTVFSVRYRP